MGLGRGDVLAVEMPVEFDRSVDLLPDGVGARRKPPTPPSVAHPTSTTPLMTETKSSFAKKRLAMVLAGGIAGVAVGLAGVYGVSTLTRNAGGDAACRPAVDLARKIAPFARGEVAAVNVAKRPLRVPDRSFQAAKGRPVTLAQSRRRTPH